MFSQLLWAEEAAADAVSEAGGLGSAGSLLGTIGMVVVMIALMYFLTIRPQRKQEKKAKEMRSNLEIGDEIVTIGGIIGTVVSLREDSIVIETGGNRNKIRIQRAAIAANNTVHDDVPAEKK
ncbi:MAG: preprotein translocase subunit YajC [Oscillospiraceae bacterium]|nr:preprotein translocase subunit YajC [Oscillospiraceae bacterium]